MSEGDRGRRANDRRASLIGLIVLPLVWLSAPAPARAEDASEDEFFGWAVPDRTLRRSDDPDTWLRPTVRMDAAYLVQSSAWAGHDREILGQNTDSWTEFGLIPAIDGQVSLQRYGKLDGRLSGVFTTTQLGMDAAASNLGPDGTTDPKDFTLEDFYVRWTSGDSVPSLGRDALEISVGPQSYSLGPAADDDLGDGFLFYDGGSDGGSRGALWLGLRYAFRMTAIARVQTGPFEAEAVYLNPNDDDPYTSTDVAGVNLAYDFGGMLGRDFAELGVGYFNIFDSADPRRDGLDIANVRVDVAPTRALPGLRLTGEMVKENNGGQNDSWGAWGELGYDFDANDVRFAPYASYRIAYFTGDDQTGENSAFDPLFYGSSDWNYWALGEIAGNWVAGNSNTTSYILRLRANPWEPVTTQFFWIYTRLNETQSGVIPPGGRPPTDPLLASVTDKDMANELNFIVDWEVNDHLLLSTVGAVLMPLHGGEQLFGSSDTWGQWTFYATTTF
jgi:hypothetical protein